MVPSNLGWTTELFPGDELLDSDESGKTAVQMSDMGTCQNWHLPAQ
jgi:hypothetical protein